MPARPVDEVVTLDEISEEDLGNNEATSKCDSFFLCFCGLLVISSGVPVARRHFWARSYRVRPDSSPAESVRAIHEPLEHREGVDRELRCVDEGILFGD